MKEGRKPEQPTWRISLATSFRKCHTLQREDSNPHTSRLGKHTCFNCYTTCRPTRSSTCLRMESTREARGRHRNTQTQKGSRCVFRLDRNRCYPITDRDSGTLLTTNTPTGFKPKAKTHITVRMSACVSICEWVSEWASTCVFLHAWVREWDRESDR